MPAHPAQATDSDQQPPETRCAHCPRLLHYDELDRWACRVCEDRAQEHIAALPGLYRQLCDQLAPGATGADAAGHVSGATRSAPLPVSLAALDLIAAGGMVTRLQAVEDDWRRTLGWRVATFRGSQEQTLGEVTVFLRNNVGWACSRYEDVADDLRLIGDLWARADAVVNGVRERRVPIGCCPVKSEAGVLCGERLRVSPWALFIKCSGCGTRWDRDEWLKLGAILRGFPVPGAAVA